MIKAIFIGSFVFSMNHLGFQADIKITDFIKQHDFTLSAEIIPPRNGAEQGKVLEQIKSLVQAGAQFLSVTKGAGGSLRGGSLPIAQAIKEKFAVPCIAHFTCRDLTPQETENQLMDHHYFGIRNILALRGDPPQDQPHWNPQTGAYQYAYQLIDQIKKLNKGHYLKRPENVFNNSYSQEDTDFCIGAAVYPEHDCPEERIQFFKRKVEAGAEYGITQMIFDPSIYAEFIESAAKANCYIPVLVGTRVLKNKKQAEKMMTRFGVSLPSSLLSKLPNEEDPDAQARAVDLFQELCLDFKKEGAPGIHFFVLSDTALACRTIQSLLS